jgi:tetratricopeptide (TPR) repeat protein
MQFSVEDWDIEALDENIGIWGEYATTDSGVQLDVFIENDLLTGQDNETQKITIETATLPEMLTALPELVQKIADVLGASLIDETTPLYTVGEGLSDSVLEGLFIQTLQWEQRLLGHLWDIEWDDPEIIAAYEALLAAANLGQGDFGAWLAAQAVAQTMRPGYSVIGDLLVDHLSNFETTFASAPNAIPIVADAVFTMGQAQDAYQLLEEHTAQHPRNTQSWLKLGDLYARGGRANEAIDRFQTAIENEAVNQYLYRSYGNLLVLVDQYQDVYVEEFVLIDPDEYDPADLLLQEAVAAYEASLRLNAENPRVWYAKLEQLAALGEEKTFWDGFARLVPLDPSGELTRELIESMYDFEDVSPGIAEIEKQQHVQPERVDLYINLALLYLTAEDESVAKGILEKASELTSDIATLSDIENLLLRAENPEFEYRFGELATITAAGNALNADDVEFLEDAAENAPHFVDVHLTLAQAYDAWGDKDAALEVLLDTQEKLPDHPEVLRLLTRILWDSGERELAFKYLNRGLETFPFDVPLLVQAGHLLFINEQFSESRRYLALAQEIQPRNAVLREVQTFIARQLADNPELARKAAEE